MMSEFEMDIAGKIMEFAFENIAFTSEISQSELVDMYWKDYFNSCEMKNSDTGMELLH